MRAASIVLVVLLNLSLIGILMVPSVSEEVKNVFADLFEKYTSYETKEQESFVFATSDYIIGYIPKDFELLLSDDYQILFREINQGNIELFSNSIPTIQWRNFSVCSGAQRNGKPKKRKKRRSIDVVSYGSECFYAR